MRRAAASLLLAALVAAVVGRAAAADGETDPGPELVGNVRGTTVQGLRSKAEEEMASQMLRAFTM